jgi:wobble nucleotide-excising tRNase
MMELEAHFSTEYVRFLERLDEQIHNIRVESNNIEKLELPKSAELYEDLSVEYEAELSSLREALDLANTFLDDLEKIMTEKKGCVFKSLDFNVAAPEIDSGCVSRLNEVIRKHNSTCENFQKILSDARKSIEDDLVAASITDFIRLKEDAQAPDVIITLKDRSIINLEKKISQLESEIIEYRKSADELNDDLRKYLGHGELCLVVQDTGYKITRNDAPAHSLSEGEMTAISLLYFLKSLQDRRFDLLNGIVVLDDPVSSLDANALYLAFGLIRERTKDAAQLFILTHNFAFFREVRTWFHHLDGQRKSNVNMRPARFYMLECIRDGDTRCSYIRHLDPLLEQYESEYHYIFACIYRAATSTSPGDLADNYVLPNMARRLLETFLAFRQPHISGQLYQKLKNIEFDGARKSRILRFLHMHSHSDVVGEPEHDLSILSEAGPVLKDLLEFVKDQDRGHYVSMVKLIDPGAEEEDSV